MHVFVCTICIGRLYIDSVCQEAIRLLPKWPKCSNSTLCVGVLCLTLICFDSLLAFGYVSFLVCNVLVAAIC